MTYIKKALLKLKDDLLSKGLYDFIKWLFIFGFMFLFTRWIPTVREWLTVKIKIDVYWIILSSIGLILITTFLINYLFKTRVDAIKEENHTDDLTGLKNHKALNEYLTKQISLSIKSKLSLSIIILDIDDFKNFNTKYGYSTADELLKKTGELLASDKRNTDETFRYFNRGDEFLVVAKETSLSQAIIAADRKRNLIGKNTFLINEQKHKLTVCCGVTELQEKDDFKSLTDRVILALNESKKTKGKNVTKSIS
jgi:diguanylate cyclase (GGDEF)-like protein